MYVQVEYSNSILKLISSTDFAETLQAYTIQYYLIAQLVLIIELRWYQHERAGLTELVLPSHRGSTSNDYICAVMFRECKTGAR